MAKPGRDEIGRPAVVAERERFPHAEDQHGALDLHPRIRAALVAVQAGDLPVAAHLAAFGVGKACEDFPAAREVFDARLQVDQAHVEELARGLGRGRLRDRWVAERSSGSASCASGEDITR